MRFDEWLLSNQQQRRGDGVGMLARDQAERRVEQRGVTPDQVRADLSTRFGRIWHHAAADVDQAELEWLRGECIILPLLEPELRRAQRWLA